MAFDPTALPQAVQDAAGNLEKDLGDLTTEKATDAEKQATLVQATADAQGSAAAVVAGQQAVTGDVTALKAAIDAWAASA